ncbi:MAG: hypothetical protein ACW99F_13095 [Candidatus Hodarchaeales archaeon]|jgi:hypothetical protein
MFQAPEIREGGLHRVFGFLFFILVLPPLAALLTPLVVDIFGVLITTTWTGVNRS